MSIISDHAARTHIVPCSQAVFAVLKNVAGFVTKRRIYRYVTKMVALGYVYTLGMLCVPPNAVQVGLPLSQIS